MLSKSQSLVLCLLLACVIEPSIAAVKNKDRNVAFLCGFKHQYYKGRWATDHRSGAECIHENMDVLDYCRQVYPDNNITNVAQLPYNVSFSNWCPSNSSALNQCIHNGSVRPFICLDATSMSQKRRTIPDGCNLDQFEDRSVCQTWEYWQSKADLSCRRAFLPDNIEGQLLSFSASQPCSLGLFSAYNCLCCPNSSVFKRDMSEEFEEDDEEDIKEDDDDDEIDDDDEDTQNIDVDASEIRETTIDHYLKNTDIQNEPENFKNALLALEAVHKRKVTQIIDQWNKLEEKYNKVADRHSSRALKFRKKMITDYKSTMSALESKTKADRDHLIDIHERRMLVDFNLKFKNSLERLAHSLKTRTPDTNHILNLAKTAIELVEKFRLHLINRYRSDLRKDLTGSDKKRSWYVSLLVANDRTLNKSLSEIKSSTFASVKHVYPDAVDFWQTLREEQTPDVDNDLILWIGDSNNIEHLFVFYKNQFFNQIESREKVFTTSTPHTSSPVSLSNSAHIEATSSKNLINRKSFNPKFGVSFNKLQHAEESTSTWLGSGGFWAFLIGGTVLGATCAAIYMVMRRKSTVRRRGGFVQVDVNTPEERHVAHMQVNGYSNPTYKFYEQT